MHKHLILIMTLSASPLLTAAEDHERSKQIAVSELNAGTTVVGALGKPVFTVHKVRGKFIKGAASKREFAGSVSLEVTHVDDQLLATPIKIDFAPWNNSLFLKTGERIAYTDGMNERDSVIGKNITCYAYEDLQTEGVPEQAKQYVEVSSKSPPHFYPIIIILKVLP
jgi:hypothetical protein